MNFYALLDSRQGHVEKVSEEESNEYFYSRPRGSRLGAWASNQSHPIGSREELDALSVAVQQQYKDNQEIPRPKHWGGFRLVPHRIEFWKGRQSRLHDRIVYTKEGDHWVVTRLQP